MKYLDLSPNEVLELIDDPIGRKLTEKILEAFTSKGLTYKVDEKYRIKCYNDKRKESLIIDTAHFKIQFRIKDWRTFEKLDEYSENVRDTVLVYSKQCTPPATNPCGKEYVFMYHGKEYRICHKLNKNFMMKDIKEEDIESIMDIVNNEIAFDK